MSQPTRAQRIAMQFLNGALEPHEFESECHELVMSPVDVLATLSNPSTYALMKEPPRCPPPPD
jgi:hypothetical protein